MAVHPQRPGRLIACQAMVGSSCISTTRKVYLLISGTAIFKRMRNTWNEIYDSKEEEEIFLNWFHGEIAARVRQGTRPKLPELERQVGYTDPNKKSFLTQLKAINQARKHEQQPTGEVAGCHHDSDEDLSN